MTVALNLDDVAYQSALRSKPVRDNFTDLQNACNDLQSQIDGLATPPAGTEVTNARDYHDVLRDRLRSASKASGNVVVSGGAVTQQGSPNMTVAVAAGEAVVDGVACAWDAANSGTISVAALTAGQSRYDVVVINSDNTLSVVAGTASLTPSIPAIVAGQKALAIMTLSYGQTSIVTANITDARHVKSLITNDIATDEINEHTVNAGTSLKTKLIVATGATIRDKNSVTRIDENGKATFSSADLSGANKILAGATIKDKNANTLIDENGKATFSSADLSGANKVLAGATIKDKNNNTLIDENGKATFTSADLSGVNKILASATIADKNSTTRIDENGFFTPAVTIGTKINASTNNAVFDAFAASGIPVSTSIYYPCCLRLSGNAVDGGTSDTCIGYAYQRRESGKIRIYYRRDGYSEASIDATDGDGSTLATVDGMIW